MLRRLLTLMCLAAAAACDGDADVIRLRYRDGSELFLRPTAERTPRGATVLLTVCAQPSGGNAGVSFLCAAVQLDPERLAALPGDASLRIEGSAIAPGDFLGEEVPFEPGRDHAPAVLAAWTAASCFGPGGGAGTLQQLRGELRFEERSAERWRGRLELHAEGPPGGDACAARAEGADFEVRFELP